MTDRAQRACSNCGAPLREGVAFCETCGHPVESVAPPAATPKRKGRGALVLATVVIAGVLGAAAIASNQSQGGDEPSPQPTLGEPGGEAFDDLSFLVGVAEACGAGDMSACDALYETDPPDPGIRELAMTCGFLLAAQQPPDCVARSAGGGNGGDGEQPETEDTEGQQTEDTEGQQTEEPPPIPALTYEELFGAWTQEIESYLASELGSAFFPLRDGYLHSQGTAPFQCQLGEFSYFGWYCGYFDLDDQAPQDFIATDDVWAQQQIARGGIATLGFYLAHEWGHAASWRTGVEGIQLRDGQMVRTGFRNVQTELVADCYAGAFIGHVERNGTTALAVAADEVQRGAAWFGALGDEKGTWSWDQPGIHGSPDVRAEWIELGRSGGPLACTVTGEREDPFGVYLDAAWWTKEGFDLVTHVDLTALGRAGENIGVAVFFDDGFGNWIPAGTDPQYTGPGGNLTVQMTLVPDTDEATYTDLQLRLPPSALPFVPANMRAIVQLFTADGELQAKSPPSVNLVGVANPP